MKKIAGSVAAFASMAALSASVLMQPALAQAPAPLSVTFPAKTATRYDNKFLIDGGTPPFAVVQLSGLSVRIVKASATDRPFVIRSDVPGTAKLQVVDQNQTKFDFSVAVKDYNGKPGRDAFRLKKGL